MKNLFLILSIALLGMTTVAQAQINVGGIIHNRVNNRAAQKVEEATDKAIDEMSENSKKKKENEETSEATADENADASAAEAGSGEETTVAKPAEMKLYSKYDFVPGDKVLFEDNLAKEESGEFPSRWDLVAGNAEIADFNGSTVINFVDAGTKITPLMSKENYLPDVFTIEFDVYFDTYTYYTVNLWNEKKHKSELNGNLDVIVLNHHEVRMPNLSVGSAIPGSESYNKQGQWKHVAMAFNKRSLKIYLDQHRLLNMPVVDGKPTGLTIEGNHYNSEARKMLVKNIRIAEGGKDLYSRVETEGKIVTHGITFDVNKATIRPESMGTINQIVKLLKEKSELNFSIEGHTDSDGDEASNQKLSLARAESVKKAFTDLGIEASRLSTKGFGETKPLGSNDSPEGKANNRRVEFVKK